MEACEIPREEILPPPVAHLEIKDDSCGFECVKEAAMNLAGEYGSEPRLLSWFDRKAQTHSQPDECCVEGEPSWIAYAQARNANLAVDVNHEEYVFLFHHSGKSQ